VILELVISNPKLTLFFLDQLNLKLKQPKLKPTTISVQFFSIIHPLNDNYSQKIVFLTSKKVLDEISMEQTSGN
jgi:hypothetical protein